MNPQDNQPVNPQQQVVERLRTAVNVLVTVSSNPSVDQLAASIGLTLLLNKLGKHATTVFSGAVPSTIEFLKPEQTIEKNTDSLRDFIVSLDKSKADKLRYKVEQNVVKIFITPYHTSIDEKDLEFSQGDFNVDVVLALGISQREQLDQAITAHGRILHDATVISVSTGEKASSLGAINWQDQGAASLCEMVVGVSEALQPNLIDTQAATALLTGIVAQTNRFSNEKTTPKIMSLASQLMAAGANQQLIATQLEKATEVPLKAGHQAAAAKSDGALSIEHEDKEDKKDIPEEKKEESVEPEPIKETSNEIAIDEHGIMSPAMDKPKESRHRVVDPLRELKLAHPPASPTHPFTANMKEDSESEASTDPMTLPSVQNQVTLSHDSPVTPANPFVPAPNVTVPPSSDVTSIPPAMDNSTLREIEKNFDSPHIAKDPTSTLNEIEESVDSPHVVSAEGLDSARDAVNSAISSAPYDPTRPQPLQALNASPLSPTGPDPVLAGLGLTNDASSQGLSLPPVVVDEDANKQADSSDQAPPPVPPPMTPVQ